MKLYSNFKCLLIAFCFIASACEGQQLPTKTIIDFLSEKTLDSIIVYTKLKASEAGYLPDLSGMNIYAGKRTNTLQLNGNTPGLQQNVGRTLMARIPGLNMWEMDGAGTQLNIGSRGTDPHRSIEMNMRQNGYNTNSDIFGYPENHYTVPMQAVEEVQLVRGSSALQFGPQFGGMMNYRLKTGDSTKPLAIESEQTAGSNNYFNSFTAAGGTKGKLNYYAFYDNRHGDGWRDNAAFSYHSYYMHLGYQINKRINITAEFSRMDYVQQIAGGLTDAQFKANPKQSERSRNYFQPIINIPALKFTAAITQNTKLEITANGIFGQRNSVQFINAGNIPDTINTTIGNYNLRQVDRDYYAGVTAEARLLHQYKIGKINSVLSGGARYFTELTKRKQKGAGTSGSDFTLSLNKTYGTDLSLTTHNYAFFAENNFQITPALSIIPGVRYEVIDTDLRGFINAASTAITYKSARNFPLFGLGMQYQLTAATQLYGNLSQQYRPYLYSNITPPDRLDKIDPNLKDSKGYTIDLGYRGRFKNIAQYELNVFYLRYNNKVGLLNQTDAIGNAYLYSTNVGNSVTKGVEAFGEVSFMKLLNPAIIKTDIKIFNSLAYNNARYVSGVINQLSSNQTIKGNYVENAPAWVNKSGIDFRLNNMVLNFQYSFTSMNFNDAFNSVSSSNGVIGIIPAYHVWDCSFSWQLSKQLRLGAVINNFTNNKYFNRRITFYPGPGILPADGRTGLLSLAIHL